MKKIYPQEMIDASKRHDVKKYFVSDIQKVGPHDCENCGGAGVMGLFLCKKGPYSTPSFPGEFTNHFDNSIGKWWAGQTYTFPCPVCLGQGEALAPLEDHYTQPAIEKFVSGKHA